MKFVSCFEGKILQFIEKQIPKINYLYLELFKKIWLMRYRKIKFEKLSINELNEIRFYDDSKNFIAT